MNQATLDVDPKLRAQMRAYAKAGLDWRKVNRKTEKDDALIGLLAWFATTVSVAGACAFVMVVL